MAGTHDPDAGSDRFRAAAGTELGQQAQFSSIGLTL